MLRTAVFCIPYQEWFPHNSLKLYVPAISGQITKLGQVILPPQEVCDASMTEVFERPIWNLGDIIKLSIPTKQIPWILNFDYLRLDKFGNLPIVKQWEKISFHLICNRSAQLTLNGATLHHCWWSRYIQMYVGDLYGRHLWSPEVNNSSLLITHDWKHLETWAWPHCACFVMRCRLIRNTTYLVR